MSRTYRNVNATNFPPVASATRQEICDFLNLDLPGFERLLSLKAIESENERPEPDLLPTDEFPDAPPVKFPGGFKPDKLTVLQIQNAVCEFVWNAVVARLPDSVSKVVAATLSEMGITPTPPAAPADPTPNVPNVPVPAVEVPISNMTAPDFFPLPVAEYPVDEPRASVVEPGGEPAAALDPPAAVPQIEEPAAALVPNVPVPAEPVAAEPVAAGDATQFDPNPSFAGGDKIPDVSPAPAFDSSKVGEGPVPTGKKRTGRGA